MSSWQIDCSTGNDPGRSAAGKGKADLLLTGGQLQFKAPIIGISSVDLQNIQMQLELHNREITVVKAELAGSEMKASMTGTIQLQTDIMLSQLNLKGTLEPLAEFYKNYPEIRELRRHWLITTENNTKCHDRFTYCLTCLPFLSSYILW